MKINFNNARKQCGLAYNSLVKELNENIDAGGFIEVHTERIQESLDNLRMYIGTILATYVEGDDDFKDMSDVIDLECFMPEE